MNFVKETFGRLGINPSLFIKNFKKGVGLWGWSMLRGLPISGQYRIRVASESMQRNFS
jgi:hypothetical protein